MEQITVIDYAKLAQMITARNQNIDYEKLAQALLNEASRPSPDAQKRSTKKKSTLHRKSDDGEYRSYTTSPIKNKAVIASVREYFLSREQYNNHMLFVVGISVGLRISDLLSLRFIDVMNEQIEFRDEIILPEIKTGKPRVFALSDVAKDAIRLYIDKVLNWRFSMGDYLFPPRKQDSKSAHIDQSTANRALGAAFAANHLDMNHGTHVLRKTFAYHVLTGTNDPLERSRRLEVLQHMLNHSSPAITLAYAGITADEEQAIYKNLDFGIDPVSEEIISKSAD